MVADLGTEERRVNAQSSDIPIELVNKLSIEDHRFFNHRGIDSIPAGAFLRNLTSRGGLQGGSTLTQQLIKLTYFQHHHQTKQSHVRPRSLAINIQLEELTKQEIGNILSIKYTCQMVTWNANCSSKKLLW